MSRKILCEKCGAPKPMHPEDAAMGFKQRRVVLRAKKPDTLGINFYSRGEQIERTILQSLMCDNCGTPIPDGQPAVAVTMWRGDEEPAEWESGYQ